MSGHESANDILSDPKAIELLRFLAAQDGCRAKVGSLSREHAIGFLDIWRQEARERFYRLWTAGLIRFGERELREDDSGQYVLEGHTWHDEPFAADAVECVLKADNATHCDAGWDIQLSVLGRTNLIGAHVEPPEEKGPRRKPLEWATQAMMLVNQDPHRSDADIAREVRIDRSRLSRNPLYRAAAKIARENHPPPRGFKSSDGSIEAADSEYRPDRHTEE